MPTPQTTFAQQLGHHAELGAHLSPAFLRSLEVLQLDADALVREIDAECARNEVLRVVPRTRERRGDPERSAAFLETVEDRPVDLFAHLRRELAFLDLAEGLAAKVLALAGRLDERGFLDADRGELAALVGAESLDAALAVLHALPPRGIGARDAAEAMLMQLEAADPDRPLVEAILRQHLGALAAGRRAEVAEALGIDAEGLDALVSRIRDLDPAPGRRFANAPAEPLRPDLAVALEQGRLVVSVGDGSLPSLAIDRRIAGLAAEPGMPRERRRELAGKLRSARSLIHAIAQRQATLQQIGAALFAQQREFLRRGAAGIRRVRMGELAASLGLHASTVSRAVAGKTVWTPHGLLALREFFEDAGRGPTRAERDALVAAIRGLLVGDPRRSDAELAAELARRGLTVARRTVAKYRALLGLSRSQLRSSDGPPESEP